MASLTYMLFLGCLVSLKGAKGKICEMAQSQRFDCYPDPYASQEKCEARGCCWMPPSNNRVHKTFQLKAESNLDIPYCFFPKDFGGYQVTGRIETESGFQLSLQLRGPGGPYGNNLEKLLVNFILDSKSSLRVKITDVERKRYQVPITTPGPRKRQRFSAYDVSYTEFPFGFKVQRRSNNRTVFDSTVGGFIFSDQFIQLSSRLPSHNIYGLGEHVLGLKLDTKWTELTLFARDVADPKGGFNLYGVHPYYMNIEDDGNANGVFFLNSNAMDIVLQPTPAITYRAIGGIVDLNIFLGPSPDEVQQQYTDLIGKAVMPPYWALGFHLCRWGYGSVDGMKKVLQRMQENQIPQDVQWNDIDHMDAKRDFTVDPNNFKDLSMMVKRLHDNGMHYVLILDPAVSNTKGDYAPYLDGLKKNVFIRNQAGDVLVGRVWPGNTLFPDFFHPNTSIFWKEQIAKFYQRIQFDGLWIDMNEPSNFVDGSTKGCPQSSLETPPYNPHVIGGALKDKTICMTAKQQYGVHYNLHNLYGYSEGTVTMDALKEIRGRRSLVIGRSTFAGSGAHQGHWLGDNHSTWDDLYSSIAGILNFNLFGIPLVGADICGFIGDTNEELCSRWMQLGAFYPFSRNHNTIGARDQDPAAFGPTLIKASKNALLMRYKLLPFLNTLFADANVTGSAVARPLFYEFPEDKNTWAVDSQFLWGSSLLITPVVTQGAKSVRGYFPAGNWYDLHDGSVIASSGEVLELQGSFDRVNLHLRHGAIIPTQKPSLTTTKSVLNPYGLLVAPDEMGAAVGRLYLDDGEALDPINSKTFSMIRFSLENGTITVSQLMKGFTPHNTLSEINVFGLAHRPNKVSWNGHQLTDYTYDQKNHQLTIKGLKIDLLTSNWVSWS